MDVPKKMAEQNHSSIKQDLDNMYMQEFKNLYNVLTVNSAK